MTPQKTHQETKPPQIPARHLADYMAASETTKRRIVRDCKYPPTARILHHDEARAIIGRFLREAGATIGTLTGEARTLRDRAAGNEPDRELLDRNADYVERFAAVVERLILPNAERLAAEDFQAVEFHGLRVPFELQIGFRRLARTNRVRTGGAMLRYSRNKPLPAEVAAWQSALLFGALRDETRGFDGDPELQLCITIDAWLGIAYRAPSDAVRRYGQIVSACASIMERWPNVRPPEGAVL